MEKKRSEVSLNKQHVEGAQQANTGDAQEERKSVSFAKIAVGLTGWHQSSREKLRYPSPATWSSRAPGFDYLISHHKDARYIGNKLVRGHKAVINGIEAASTAYIRENRLDYIRNEGKLGEKARRRSHTKDIVPCVWTKVNDKAALGQEDLDTEVGQLSETSTNVESRKQNDTIRGQSSVPYKPEVDTTDTETERYDIDRSRDATGAKSSVYGQDSEGVLALLAITAGMCAVIGAFNPVAAACVASVCAVAIVLSVFAPKAFSRLTNSLGGSAHVARCAFHDHGQVVAGKVAQQPVRRSWSDSEGDDSRSSNAGSGPL